MIAKNPVKLLIGGMVCSLTIAMGACAFADTLPLPAAPEAVMAEPQLQLSAQPEQLALRDATVPPSNQAPNSGEHMSISAQDPTTGNTIHIDVNSEALVYDKATQTYTLSGNVYMIIPEKEMEILADQVTMNINKSTMIANGQVFVIQGSHVIGSTQTIFDMDHDVTYYDNFRTVTQDLKLKAQTTEHYSTFTIMQEGRMVLEPNAAALSGKMRYFQTGKGANLSYLSARNKNAFLSGKAGGFFLDSIETVLLDTSQPSDYGDAGLINVEGPVPNKPISPTDVANANFAQGQERYRIHVKKIEIHRKANGFDKIELDRSVMRYGKLPIYYSPQLQFGYQEDAGYFTYLGADTGYDMDYGGFYWGPGWDVQALKGWFWFSPIVSYGGGRRVAVSKFDNPNEQAALGFGLRAHYRSPNTRIDGGWDSNTNAPLLLSTMRLFGSPHDRLRLAMNRYYANGYFGIERPNYIAELIDVHKWYPFNHTAMFATYATAGVVSDEFFPTGRRVFFVKPTSLSPITTGRMQIQTNLQTTKPILRFGNFASVGATVRDRLAVYGTGDVFGILRAGPYLNFITGPLFNQVFYLYTTTSGTTPMVFDSYFEGTNNIVTTNAIDIGKFITIGARHSLNLNQQNAKNATVVGQMFFVSMGPETVKLSLGFDAINRRSVFGLTINPSGGPMAIDYNNMNIYDPGYDRHQAERLPKPVLAPTSTPNDNVPKPTPVEIPTTPQSGLIKQSELTLDQDDTEDTLTSNSDITNPGAISILAPPEKTGLVTPSAIAAVADADTLGPTAPVPAQVTKHEKGLKHLFHVHSNAPTPEQQQARNARLVDPDPLNMLMTPGY